MTYATPFFADHFPESGAEGVDDATRFFDLLPGASCWPPNPPTSAGRFARCLQQGWPASTGSGVDTSARSQPGNDELGCYENSGVTLVPGTGLVLSASTTPGSHFPQLPYTTGCISQNRYYAIAGGYFELVCRLPQEPGLLPAWWMMPADGTWDFEIDNFEQSGINGENIASPSSYRLGANNANNSTSMGQYVDNIDTAAWHKIGLLWQPGGALTQFRDDVQVAQIPCPPNATKPAYMIVNLAVGGKWPGAPKPGFVGAAMSIRSISSYKLGSWGSSLIPLTAPAPGQQAVTPPVAKPLPENFAWS